MKASELAVLAQDFDLSDADIEDAAEKLAARVRDRAELWQASHQGDAEVMQALKRTERRHHVALPHGATLAQALNRMTSPAWWRRALRTRLRVVEAHQIARGAVHRQASPYVSAKAFKRRIRDAQRIAKLLASLDAVNLATGEALPLENLIATSQANPAMRRMAMMARIRGIETHATSKEHAALFLTITAPSRMHPRLESGQANHKHDGTTPRQAQAYLHQVWRRALRAAAHQGLEAYGLRTVEPHHDACPHWHVLLFTRPADQARLLTTMRAYALADNPSEPGAALHRFRVEVIDRKKGSAAAYVAKYVSKSIDGHGVDDDTESAEDGPNAAKRIVSWARVWGIRQFQFFGLPAITPTRELYRVSGAVLQSPALTVAHTACKANDYGAYLAAMETHCIGFGVHYEPHPSSRYAGEITKAIRGLIASACDTAAPLTLTTRTETWCIQPRAVSATREDFAPPWTRINNCASPAKSTTYDRPTTSAPHGHQRPPLDPRLRPPNTQAKQLEAVL
jgi:hypothetical protein